MPSEKPILFSGDMVRAILDGRKTQTRRIVKQIHPDDNPVLYGPEWYEPVVIDRSGIEQPGEPVFGIYSDDGWGVKCRYGAPGDRLWVRETWSPDHEAFYPHHRVVHRADYPIDIKDGWTFSPEQKQWHPFKWRPSIHMPRWASRLTLEVTDVRVERLQEIREADAAAEGADPILVPPDGGSTPYTEGFRSLWNSINGKRPGCDWKSNPFVWAVSFRRIEA